MPTVVKNVTVSVTSPATPSQTVTKTQKVSTFTGQRVTKTLVVNLTPPLTTKTKFKTVSVTSSGPNIILGGNKIVEAGSNIVLTPLTENQGSAPITDRKWKNGATVVGTSATCQVPAPISKTGSTMSYDYVVTDQNNMTTTASVGITVLPAPLRGPGGKAMVEKAPDSNAQAQYNSSNYNASNFGA